MEAEERIRRLSRAINCLCLSTDTVLTARTEAELLDGICRVAVDVSGYRLAWIGYAEEVPDRLVRPVAQAGYDDGYLDQARIHWSDDERSTGPTGRAIRTSQAVACQDLTTEPSYAPWRAEALRRGYASSLALPLIIDGRVMGALNLYASEPDAFEAEEVALLERLAGSLAHGIAALRTQQEHQRSRAQVRDRNAQLKAIYTASPDMIFLHAADGRIVDANQRAVERYGRSRDELFHATPESMMGGDHTPEEALGYLLRAQAGEQLDFEWVARHAGGEEFPVEVRLRRLELEDDGSESPCVLAIVRDLADRLRIERERANVEKLRALGILAGGIAHDFNNLLTGITGNISLALDREQAAPVSHLLDQALAASSRAASLTKQLLTFSRGSATGHRRISLDAVVIEAARFALHGSAAKLETVFDEAPRYVDGDADQLSHAVHNLVLNAVQAMPRGGRSTELTIC